MSAQFKEQVIPPPIKVNGQDPFAAMGKPIPFKAMQVGYEHCIQMGLKQQEAHTVTGMVAEQLARDKPYEAMEAGMKYLDLTGTYRLMAAILANAVQL